jgi:hypothetical protein
MDSHKGDYTVFMDERWSMEDLYQFPKAFEQAYYFTHFFGSSSAGDLSSLQSALEQYPFEGGYSVVNFYKLMKGRSASAARPKIAKIRYASPGWMDLFLDLPTALEVAKHVAAYIGGGAVVVKSVRSLQKTVYEIYDESRKRGLSKTMIAREYAEELNRLSDEVARSFGFDNYKMLKEVARDPLEAAQLLLAHERRLKQLVEYVDKGKVSLPLVPPASPGPSPPRSPEAT